MRSNHRLMAVLALSALSASGLLAACGASTSPSIDTGGGSPAPSGQPYTKGAPVTPNAGKQVTIGVAFPELDPYLKTVVAGIEARAKESGVNVRVVSVADNKTYLQFKQVQDLIAAKVDAMIVNPIDTNNAGPVTKIVRNAKVPLVYVNRMPAGLPDGVPYVGSESLVSGTLQMEELAKQAGGKGNVVVLEGDPKNEAAVLRTVGCKNVVAKHPGMKITQTQDANWERAQARSIVASWLAAGEQIDVVCANNDEMAIGAIEALKAANKLSGVIVGGVDGTAEGLAAMKAGDLKVSVFQDGKSQGAGAVDAAIRLVNGEQVPAFVNIPYRLITPSNLAQFAAK